MIWCRLMFAVASPGDLQSPVMDKIAHLTGALRAELELFHCLFDPHVAQQGRFGSHGVEQDIRDFVEQRQAQLAQHVERLRAQGLHVHASVRWDESVRDGIVRQVLRIQPDLLIVQASSHHERWALGESDYRIIETCPSALLLLKTTRPYLDSRVIAAVDPMQERDKPAALDDAILEAASAFARPLAAKQWVFHARMPWRDAVRAQVTVHRRPDAEAAYCRDVEARVVELARRHDLSEEQVEIVDGYVSEKLPEFARHNCADVVAVGIVPRSLLNRVLLGHNAQPLLDALDCDLLIVKPPGWRAALSAQSVHHAESSVDAAS
jgi:universal stress protein E